MKSSRYHRLIISSLAIIPLNSRLLSIGHKHYQIGAVIVDWFTDWSIFCQSLNVLKPIPKAIPRIQISDLTDHKHLDGPVCIVMYRGKKYAFQAHQSVYQNRLFPIELFARVELGDIPHIAKLIGIVLHECSMDRAFYIVGMLLEYCEKADLKFILQHSNPPVEWSRKARWAV